jgi:type I restriction enzyme M protein
MAIKKSELYSSLWASCDELRGGMDASQYKDYVLVLLFVKYVSDRYAGQPFAQIAVPPGASFDDMVALKGKPDIGDQINKKIIGPLWQANQLSDPPDFNDPGKLGGGKEMVERLTNLIATFENPDLDFSKNRAEGDDLLGDAYEYLMRHFATESGKSKGQFYTPAEVSRTIAQILGVRRAEVTNDTSVYDPTCGSGSLLLKIADEAEHGRDVKVSLFGQEKDNATAGLARMNMILHDYATAEIKQGNTLANPLFKEGNALKTFDYVVANPPFSDKRWSTGLDAEHDEYQRFQPYGIPPRKQGDYAYLLHILRSLKHTGKGTCILPHGVLFRGNVEAAIRRNLVQRGYIKGIIGLPENLFFGTGIPACIVVVDKENASARKGIFMIDASKGFRKDGPKNRLREQDIHRIVDTFNRQLEIPRYSRLVPVAEISDARNDYNLNLPRYIDGTEAEDLQDIDAHLHGGIPERDIDLLQSYWDVVPSVRAVLFASNSRPGYIDLRVPVAEIKATIFGHPEFDAFKNKVRAILVEWENKTRPLLKNFGKDSRPKALIETISETLLESFRPAPLLNAYDVYQHLMDYWAETMQDDCYLIADDGWRAAAEPRLIVEDKTKKTKSRADLVVGKKKYQSELIPPQLVVARYFADEKSIIDAKTAELDAVIAERDQLEEENSGEEGAFFSLDKINKASVAAALVEAQRDAKAELKVAEEPVLIADGEVSEPDVLLQWVNLHNRESELKKKLKEAEEALARKVLAKYGALTEDEIKALIVDDKWRETLAATVQGELDRVSQNLTGRIRQLAERYETPLQQLTDEVATLAARVDGHLRKMGAVWK